ncbi:nucleotidyltransferase domain-containing protein [Streptomyces albofaciens JCM 4342]|uniref:nucleotidyltransferase domain-containing protein n=1 Tax=Streptomyces albofaciens TaxID=66866 RepID=UPI001238FEC3|nr:nucleotidyltransferase domain-containing protein [Streptomyces albofaciens]KAA6221147.1 nucleotidyltransferase domain-containing protein [Streptomyces albofaciens JCM 4342]
MPLNPPPENGPSAPPRVIAVSGPAHVGKSTQLRLLARRTPRLDVCHPAEEHAPQWPALLGTDRTGWWLRDVSYQELADVLAASFLTRARQPNAGGLRCVRQGLPMLEATLAAVAAVREARTTARAADVARAALAPYRAALCAAEESEYGVVLLHDEDPAQGLARGLARSPAPSGLLENYQRRLHEQIHRLVDEGRFDTAVVVGDRPVIDIQHELRQHLHRRYPAVPECALSRVRVVALGGDSDPEREAAGEYLRTRRGYARLDAAHLAGGTAADDVTWAECLTDGLDRYCAAHPFLDRVSIEPVRAPGALAELRKIFGDRLRVRNGPPAGRAATAPWARLALQRDLDRLAFDSAWTFRPPKPVSVHSLGLPPCLGVHLRALRERLTRPFPVVDLIAVTGSAARGTYEHGRSDLDVLVLTPQERLSGLRRVCADLAPGLAGARLTMTVLTEDEFRAGALPPRLLHVLTLSGAGALAPLWCAPGLALPVPDAVTYAEGSLRDGVRAAVAIRRQLLLEDPDPYALHKATALLAKIMLRVECGAEYPADDQAIEAFRRRQGDGGGDGPDDVRHDRAGVERTAGDVLRGWLATCAAGPAGAAPETGFPGTGAPGHR